MYGDESLEGLDLIGKDGLHFHARPEAGRGLVVPSVDNACSDVLALRGCLLDAGSLADVHGELGLLPANERVSERQPRGGRARATDLAMSTLREAFELYILAGCRGVGERESRASGGG